MVIFDIFKKQPKQKTPVNIRVKYNCTVSSGAKYKVQYQSPCGYYWIDIMEWLGCGKYDGDFFNWIEFGGSKEQAERKAKKFTCLEDIEAFNKKQQKYRQKQFKIGIV